MSGCQHLARNRAVAIARWSGVAVSVFSLVFALMSYFGAWNHLRGDDLASAVATRFDSSYSENASRPARKGDPEWQPLIRIITRYTHSKLPDDREALVLARSQSVSSAKMEMGNKLLAEWTAPTTPILLLYKEWPGHGEIGTDDYRIVGTIQDLHEWIREDESDFDFRWRNIVFAILSLCVGMFLALRSR